MLPVALRFFASLFGLQAPIIFPPHPTHVTGFRLGFLFRVAFVFEFALCLFVGLRLHSMTLVSVPLFRFFGSFGGALFDSQILPYVSGC